MDAWAQRRFAVCFRDRTALAPAAVRMLEYLAARSESSSAVNDAVASPSKRARAAR